ncbi:hypothetical protein HanXRQr2_Chr10g0430331 [Helianthus annuus]|uniref:Uncharacterized protein n=1 Tax=Helianthus annuus TaxID=4232 RepID=A0A9K3N3P0_HELAN|nr:hypothetical protein HanXRQr2_Chr10g0430331 [Helianthus annuus]
MNVQHTRGWMIHKVGKNDGAWVFNFFFYCFFFFNPSHAQRFIGISTMVIHLVLLVCKYVDLLVTCTYTYKI